MPLHALMAWYFEHTDKFTLTVLVFYVRQLTQSQLSRHGTCNRNAHWLACCDVHFGEVRVVLWYGDREALGMHRCHRVTWLAIQNGLSHKP
jgi:hypothetical protein